MVRSLLLAGLLLASSIALAQDADLEAAHQACQRAPHVTRPTPSVRDWQPGFAACAEIEAEYGKTEKMRQEQADKDMIEAARKKLSGGN